MAVTPNDFHTFALATGESDDEVTVRTAISRSYYAAHHVAKAIAANLPMVVFQGKPGSHEQVIQTLTKQMNSYPKAAQLRAFGYVLAQMKGNRCDADYELGIDIDRNHFQTQVDDYDNFKVKLAAL